MREKSGILHGKKAIKDYLGVGEDYLQEYIAAGMPVLITGGKWVAHADNIEDFFRKITRVNSKGKII